MKHVIIEGPDGAGKTTLAKRLCKENRWRYHHEGPPPTFTDGRPHLLLHHYAGLLLNAKDFTVFDRFHLGELVYGPILRGQIGMPLEHFDLMRRLIDGLGTTVIFCDPGLTSCEENLHEKELLTKEQRAVAYGLWRQDYILKQVHCSYDWSPRRVNPYAVPPKLEYRESCPPGVIGSPYAKYLFVGEQANGTIDLPFFGSGPSSRYINGAIRDAGYYEDEIALTNAYDIKGNPRDIVKIVQQMPWVESIIALGMLAYKVAQPAWEWAAVDRVAHPSYWNRFHHHDRKEYVQHLQFIREKHAATR